MRGQLLIATPRIADPNFAATVILVCGHDDDGSVGVIINRPTELDAADYLPEWEGHLAEPAVVFEGGPVQREVAVGIGRGMDMSEAPILDDVGLIDLSLSPGEGAARVFSGYAGWGPGQLDAEVAAGDWFVVPALVDDAFSPNPDGLWRVVLRRQPGEMALYAQFPADPSLN